VNVFICAVMFMAGIAIGGYAALLAVAGLLGAVLFALWRR
jgi:hypothetical protein